MSKMSVLRSVTPLMSSFMGPIWGPPGSCRPEVGPMLATWTLLPGTNNSRQTLRTLTPLDHRQWRPMTLKLSTLYRKTNYMSGAICRGNNTSEGFQFVWKHRCVISRHMVWMASSQKYVQMTLIRNQLIFMEVSVIFWQNWALWIIKVDL